jgi:lysozyme
MTTSEKGIEFIAKEEGCVLHPYLDSVKKPTIGIGSTYWENGKAVSMTDSPITKARAIQLFHTTLKRYEAQVNTSVTRPINQNQFDALVSLCYNIGTSGFASSTVAKKVHDNPCDPSIRQWFEAWKNAGGKPILLARRQREANLYFS